MMHNSIKSLLEEVSKDSSKIKKTVDHVTCLICGFKEQHLERETFLTYQIRQVKKFVKEIIVSLPENYEIQDSILQNEIKDLNIKILERTKEELPYSPNVFDKLVQKSLNNRVLFLPYDFEISKIKIENIIKTGSPLVSYLGVLGNFLPFFGLIDKWKTRFSLQLMRFCDKKNLDEL